MSERIKRSSEIIYYAWEEDLINKLSPYLTSPSHDRSHVKNVMMTAIELQQSHRGDLEVIKAAVYLHDTGRHDPELHGNDSVQESVSIAKELLDQVNFPTDKIQQVVEAISQHDDSTGPAPNSIEAEILADADKLDGIGAIGVIRACMHTGEVGQSFEQAVDRLENGMRKRIGSLYFKQSKTLAEQRYKIVEELLRQLN